MAEQELTTDKPKPQRPRRRWRAFLVSLAFSLVLAACVGVVLFFLAGQSVHVPAWAQARIEDRASAAVPDGNVRFSDAEVFLQDGWLPRVRLRDLLIETQDGREIVRFSEAAAGVSLESLLQGAPQLHDVSLTGVFATLRRGADGSVAVTGGLDQSAPSQEAANFADLASSIDRVLDAPVLRGLKTADIQAVTLRYEDARSRRAWTIDGGRAQLTRENDALTLLVDLALLSGGQGVATLAANYTSRIGEPEADFGITITDVDAADIAAQGPAFAWLAPLRAGISGSMRGGFTSTGEIAPLNATLTIGQGVLQPNDITRPIPFQSARTYFTFDPGDQSLTFTEVSVDSDWGTARADGIAVLGETGEDLVVQFDVDDITLNPAGLYDQAISIEGATADFRVRFDPFVFDLGEMLLRDQGQSLVVRGDLTAQPDGWAFGFDAQMDSVQPSRLFELWPEGFGTRTRTWLTQNVLAGTLKNVDFAIRGAPVVRPDVYASFDYTGAHVRFARTLPPVENASGHAVLADNRLVIAVEDGYLTAPSGGRISTQASSFIVPDITVRGGAPGVVRLGLDGAIQSVLSVLDLPPLRIMQRANLPVDLAEGRASVVGSLSIPLRKGVQADEIEWDATGTLENVVSEVLIEDRELSARQLSLTGTQDQIRIGGRGALDGVPFDAAWRQVLGQSAPGIIEGRVTLSQDAVETFNIGLPPGTVRGSGPGQLRIELPRNEAPRFALSSQLDGIGLSMPPLGWDLAPGTPGTLEVSGRLGAAPRVDRLSLRGNALSVEGGVTLNPGGGLDQAAFRTVTLSDWLAAPVTLVGRGEGLAPEVRVDGGTIDLRTANFGAGDTSGQEPGPLYVRLDRLQITDTIALTDFAGTFDLRRGLDGRFEARVNGGPEVSGRVLPSNGRSAVRITSADAGGVVAAAGLLKQARGGTMDLTLIPVGEGGAFDGTVSILDTRVKDAPVMADLLSAVSIIGLLEQLSGNGILFSDVEADFRLTPDRVFLRQASAVGPSMGISMDGTYTTASRTLDMQGVVSPVYVLNAIGSLLTRKGEGLIGFSYRLGGSADSPRIAVNPLSALTPGMFREIFRRPPPEVPQIQDDRRSLIPEEFIQDQKVDRAASRPERKEPEVGER